MMADFQSTLVTYMSMVTALAVSANLIMAARRDKRLAAGTAQVAIKAEQVAKAVVEVKDELNISKDEVAGHRKDEAKAFGTLQDKVNATHIIVNAQKTAMMQKLADSQLFTLTLAQAMLDEKPHNQKLKDAVASAQALYDQSIRDLRQKEKESERP
jgi:hypothetical protein